MDGMSPTQKVKLRNFAIQAVFLTAVVIIIWGAVSSARTNLAALGISSGFDFLDRATGWSYSFSLIDRSIDDSYGKTLFIGFLSTLFLGIVSIILATILGFVIGTARDARNIALKSAATVFVQVFRNIPLIVQIVFLYAILIHLPGPRQAASLMELAFLSNRGLMVTGLNIPVSATLILLAVAVALAWAMRRFVDGGFGKKVGIWLGLMILISAAVAMVYAPEGESIISIPELKGLRFVGGINVPIELVAMIIGIVLYGSAYIAEVVRGGLNEVPKGLVEAGKALGLTSHSIWFKIKMPMALRTIIPPLGNQWIFLMKATTIGVAIGFSDLFMIISTSITQSGQTLELIAILMGAFLLINYSLAQLINLMNARMKLKGQ